MPDIRTPKKALAIKPKICYIIDTKQEQPPTRGWPRLWIAMPPYHWSKYKGGFCYVRLLTKRKYKCKQCQKEYAKCQQLHKRNMYLVFLMFSLFHSITPILFRMRPTHPVTRLLFWDYSTSFDASQQYFSVHTKRVSKRLHPFCMIVSYPSSYRWYFCLATVIFYNTVYCASG